MKHAQGFTLTELMLSVALISVVSVAMVSWTVNYVATNHQGTTSAEDLAYYWLHWLWGDIQNSMTNIDSWQFEQQYQCLLYGSFGVRVKNNALQWRPAESECDSRGWQALNDTHNVRFKTLSVKPMAELTSICLEYASREQPRKREEVCMPWPLH
ncbi:MULTISPECIES: type II secretion system protein J [Gammaproteobacteria]|uniref:PulJ/GspJ family protein n=1 Tax=Gammaproteobacteria TaxID=1236 RepID=UPI001403F544|nr:MULTISPECIES: prepilin-type N-terminal cleavage/methylation domain-containing protein [Gammaproteobacteria]